MSEQDFRAECLNQWPDEPGDDPAPQPIVITVFNVKDGDVTMSDGVSGETIELG